MLHCDTYVLLLILQIVHIRVTQERMRYEYVSLCMSFLCMSLHTLRVIAYVFVSDTIYIYIYIYILFVGIKWTRKSSWIIFQVK